MSQAVAVIGGSGLYDIDQLSDVEELVLDTPFGNPSDAIIAGEIRGQKVFFLARHGRKHNINPTKINYRANIYALKALGVKWCLSVNAVGSLKQELKPGDIVISDQLIDRTKARVSTFFDKGVVAHIGFADPYCSTMRALVLETCKQVTSDQDTTVHSSGTYVCMEGPAFSTRAESHLYRSWNASVIGMTALPEAKLAREAELAYVNLCMVTDYDCWKEDEAAVDVSAVLEVLQRNSNLARKIVVELVPKLASARPSDMAENALQHAILTSWESVSLEDRERLGVLVERYVK